MYGGRRGDEATWVQDTKFDIRNLEKVRKILIFRYLIRRISALTYFTSLQNKRMWWCGEGPLTKHFGRKKEPRQIIYHFSPLRTKGGSF